MDVASHIRAKLKALPAAPGVYQMKDARGLTIRVSPPALDSAEPSGWTLIEDLWNTSEHVLVKQCVPRRQGG